MEGKSKAYMIQNNEILVIGKVDFSYREKKY